MTGTPTTSSGSRSADERPSRRPRIGALTTLAVAAAAGAVLLAACGGSAHGSSPTGAATGAGNAGRSSAQSGGQGTGRQGGGFGGGPAAYGQVAALSGSTMQVQNSSQGQVAVSYTGATKFTRTVTVAKTAVVKGDCVTAVGARSASSGSSPSASSSSSSGSATAFTAATIELSKPTNGSCSRGGIAGGQGTGGQSRPSGFPTAFPSGRSRPSGFPTALRSGAAGRGFATGDFAVGQVDSVTSSGIVVTQQGFGSQSAKQITVTIDATTKITEQAATTAKALSVGECVSATGTTGSTGAVSATRIAISDPTNGSCDSVGGFGGFGGRNGGANGGGSTNGG